MVVSGWQVWLTGDDGCEWVRARGRCGEWASEVGV